MALKDLPGRISAWLGRERKMDDTRRLDGGTSCYRPVRRKNRDEEDLAREKAAEYARQQPEMVYAHTGFTGMNPPAEGMSQVQSTITGDPYGYGAAQAGMNQSWSGPFQAGMNQGYGGQTPAGMNQDSSGQPQGGTAFSQPPNISYMPGAFMAGSGSTYTHVEHIMTITSLRTCYEAIECMKNGETLIVTLDVLGSESEKLRCQDMLAGAAFTLGCGVRSLSGVGVVIISPAGVKLLPEQPSRTWTPPMPQAQSAAHPLTEDRGRRERRSSQNPVGWENAISSQNRGYNPYTGTMPAAAGAYSAYGGY